MHKALTRGTVIGALATLAYLVTLVVLVTLGVPKTQASWPALAVGVAVQFVGSKRFTFESRASRWDEARELALFLVVEAAAFGLNLAVFDFGVRHTALPYVIVRIAGSSAVYFAFSLPLWSLVFRRGARDGRPS